MEIRLVKATHEPEQVLTRNPGITIESIVKEYQQELPYHIMAALVENRVASLKETLSQDVRVELLDIRHQAANRIYQRGLSLLYLKAVNDILGPVTVEITNSLNKGLYTMIRRKEAVTEADVKRIEARMKELVAQDLPILQKEVSKEEAKKIMLANHNSHALRLSDRLLDQQYMHCYQLEEYSSFFYDLMVPSTGYLYCFELRKYRHGVLLRFAQPDAPDRIPVYKDDTKMYGAFGEATNWGKLMDVSYVADLNEQIKSGQYKELIEISEALHEKKIANLADDIKQKHKRIILIAGPSSSGKTTFAHRLIIQLKVIGLHPLYLGTDDYFLNREETPLDAHGEPNYEDLEALDIALFNDNMNSLLRGETVDLPHFNFLTGKKEFGLRKTKITTDQPILIEGIHALNGKMSEQLEDTDKYKIYISPLTQLDIDAHNRIPTTDARMLRRMVRDHRTRGYSAENTINSWPKVRTGEDKNIFPFSSEADALFNSVHLYELAVLKKYAEPLLCDIKANQPEYGEAQRLLSFLSFFETIEDDSIIAINSILREFIGGGILG